MAARRTAELLAEEKLFRPHVVAALGPQARIITDAEGWPMVPGRYGRLEWRGAEADTGEHRIYAFTDHAKCSAARARLLEPAVFVRALTMYALNIVAAPSLAEAAAGMPGQMLWGSPGLRRF